MRHVVVDDWSRGASPLHRRDPRAKLICLLVLLVAVNVQARFAPALLALGGAMVAAGLLVAGLPVWPFLARTAVALPFAAVLAATVALAGDPARAGLVLVRSWLSASAILLLASTTPLPQVLRALRAFRVPVLLVELIQFIHRYLFVLAEQVWRMRSAAAARGGQASYRAAAGAVSTLFARSYDRAERIHQAMLARGYSGELPVASEAPAREADYLLVAAVVSAFAAVAFWMRSCNR